MIREEDGLKEGLKRIFLDSLWENKISSCRRTNNLHVLNENRGKVHV